MTNILVYSPEATEVVGRDEQISVGSPSICVGSVDPHTGPQDFTQKRKQGQWKLGICAAIMLVAGTAHLALYKFINRLIFSPGPDREPQYFEAPLFQSTLCYMGEICCLVPYYLRRLCGKGQGKGERKKVPIGWWITIALLDVCGAVSANYATVLLQASTVLMLRSFTVVVTAFCTLLYLRTALRVHQWLGVAVLTVGLVISGMYAMIEPDTQTNYNGLEYVGIILAVIPAFTFSFMAVCEEKVLKTYDCSVFELIGTIGLFGALFCLGPLVIGEFAGYEKTSETFYMLSNREALDQHFYLAQIGQMVAAASFSVAGQAVTKLDCGLLFVIVATSRTFTLWLVELVFKWNGFTVLNFVGLVILLLGVAIYNYNFLCDQKRNSLLDKLLRKPLACCGVRNPDEDLRDAKPARPDVAPASPSTDVGDGDST